MRTLSFATLLLLLFVQPAAAQAIDTQVLVRALSHDAKIIGSNVGGVHITITDVATGQVLAQGRQEGSTGSTDLIMRTPRARHATVYATDEAAGYLATVALTRPTVVEIAASGPPATPWVHASKRMLLVPGQDVLGEGVLLTLYGFTVELLAPTDASGGAEGTLDVRAKVTMLCGCPTEPGGLWDADAITIRARLWQGGEVIVERPLQFSGEQSIFAGTLGAAPGAYTLEVLAMDAARGNFGRAEQDVLLLGGE